jgi:hypothetical protein
MVCGFLVNLFLENGEQNQFLAAGKRVSSTTFISIQ